ncbi:MAG: methylenetetrahydrofolate reductase [NAD(P)H] [Planctomycetota bacterium]|nr:methylenetetrahydrofolate reductase [NAD(P)H] [Planctomycetota bacterium]
MHFSDILREQGTTVSFEFFPPRSEKASGDLFRSVAELQLLKPAFVSITYGAGGSTRQLTHDLVLRVRERTKLAVVPHLTCLGHSRADIASLLDSYASAGIGTIMALRGDPIKGPSASADPGDFRFASCLVKFIQEFNEQGSHPDPRGFAVGVAGYPEGHHATPNRLREMDYLKAKVDAGASFIITQLFFDNRDFYDFRERCHLAGIRVPIIAGVMPITSLAGMRKMADLALGVRFPAPLLRAVARAGEDDECVRRVGLHWATEQCRDLLDHRVSGVHLYTLNKSTATREIYANLGVKDSTALVG